MVQRYFKEGHLISFHFFARDRNFFSAGSISFAYIATSPSRFVTNAFGKWPQSPFELVPDQHQCSGYTPYD